MHIGRMRSIVIYYALIAFLSISLILIDVSTSGLLASIQSQKFFDDEIKFIKNTQDVTNTNSLTSLVDSLQKTHDDISIIKAMTIIYLVISFIFILIFFITMYQNSKQEILENKYETHLNFINTTSFSVLLSLFFSVGLAFYFSAYLDITNYQQMITNTMFQTAPEKLASKINLLNIFLQSNSGDYYLSISNAIYFFEIFVFLTIGLLLKNKKIFLSRTLFFGSLITSISWFILFEIKPVLGG